MRLLIGADLVPTETNKTLFANGDVKTLIGEELLDELGQAEIRIFNLETPLIEKSNPITKCGPVLGINKNVISGLKKINPNYLTLANNHIMDHGLDGLITTMTTLEENNIEYGGIVDNLHKMDNSIWIKSICGYKIGIYSCCEHEFSVATTNKMGAIPFDYINSYEVIEKNKNKCDFILVLYHGGKEYYPYPSPELQKRCHEFIQKGADLVVCQHSHCIGSEEIYYGKKIIYGQGNFLFDKTNRKEWNHGMLLKIDLEKNHHYKVDYVITTKTGNSIRKATKDETKKIIDDYQNRSKNLLKENFVEENYKEFALSNEIILNLFKKTDFLSNTLLFRVLNKISKGKFLTFYFKKIYLKKFSYKLQNLIECEAWQELAIKFLKEYNLKK